MASLLSPDEAGIEAAVAALKGGRLVLHPTETVVSLSGDPYREDAVAAARRIKAYRRPRPFLCLVPDPIAARVLVADWPEAADRLAEALWPGPLTLVLRAVSEAPAPVVEKGRIALRPASDPVSTRLMAAWGGPLFSTSANPRGTLPSRRVAEADERLARAPGATAVALGLLEPADGAPAGGKPSTVVDVTGPRPRLIRAGAVPAERIRRLCPDLEET